MVEDDTRAVYGSPPVIEGTWLRPAPGPEAAEPRWGHADGLQLGLSPLPGPRGLIRVYAPYLGHPHGVMINYIAIEPTPVGADGRGYSELEHSTLDDLPGKRFELTDRPDAPTRSEPGRGVLSEVDGVEHLTAWVVAEPFDNGARVAVRTTFRADRPHEVTLAARALPGSAPLETCVLSATMGNYARLRMLRLGDAVVTPAELWPGFDRTDFTDHARFGLERFRRTGTSVTVSAVPDETDHAAAAYADDTNEHWKYAGTRAEQRWTVADPHPELAMQVNARWAYWASESPIPGGISYENFELHEPFRQDRELVFSVEPLN